MRTRRVKRNGELADTIVWFGSCGVKADGTANFFNPSDIHDNFSSEADAVADSLTQYLSIIQTELWTNTTYGLPLLDKDKTRAFIDAKVIEEIEEHPDVISITKFESKVINRNYQAEIEVTTKYGAITLSI